MAKEMKFCSALTKGVVRPATHKEGNGKQFGEAYIVVV